MSFSWKLLKWIHSVLEKNSSHIYNIIYIYIYIYTWHWIKKNPYKINKGALYTNKSWTTRGNDHLCYLANQTPLSILSISKYIGLLLSTTTLESDSECFRAQSHLV